MYNANLYSGGTNELSPKLATLEQRIEAISLQLYVQKVDHYLRWLKQDLSTLTLSLYKEDCKNGNHPNLDWIHSISMQPRISVVRQSPHIGVSRTNILKMLSGDNDFGPLISTLRGKHGHINTYLLLCMQRIITICCIFHRYQV